MKNLLVLWDPANPQVAAGPLVAALQSAEVVAGSLTFDQIGHRTLPNRAMRLRSALRAEPDGILWVEGGPLPADLDSFSCPKACWIVNAHLEPTLLRDLGSTFDQVFTASLRDTSGEQARWLPIGPGAVGRDAMPQGVSILTNDPKPPHHAHAEQVLLAEAGGLASSSVPVTIAMGNGGQVHPLLFDCLRLGAAVVTDPSVDLRGIAHVGEHLEVFPSWEGFTGFVRELLGDPDRLHRLAASGPRIVQHLHEPALRAARVREGLWPRHRILSGEGHRPHISILVTCYRYLRRFRICLESLARQELPAGSMEIVVADPSCPDGLAKYLEEFASRNPHLRVVHLPIDQRYHRNRGVGINRAFEVSKGQVVIGIDGDLVFPPTLIGFLGESVLRMPSRVFGVRRSFVGKEETERILRGELDPFDQFDQLSRSAGDGEDHPFVGVLGYCQALHRQAFARARYPEEFDMVNQSDIVFLERLQREAQVAPQYLPDRTVLHLWHPRNWAGTTESL